MKHLLFRGLLGVAVAVCAAPAAHASELKLSMQSGRVTLVAEDVPVREILAEWARVGHTTIVNADKLIGPPVTLQLVNVPEKQALDVVLRSASGYMAAPRPELVANASVYDRIMIMPTSHAPMVSMAPPPAPAPAPFQRAPYAVEPDDDSDDPMITLPSQQQPPVPQAPNSGVVGAFPGAMPPRPQDNDDQPPAPALSSRPGVVVGTPPGQKPQVPQPNPYQPRVVHPNDGGGEPDGL